jgi:CDP-diacylglycerol--serine O-phosphatidyltransferase
MIGARVAPDMVVPVVVFVVLFIATLISYPWHVLSVGALLYLSCLPLGWLSYRRHEQRARAAEVVATSIVTPSPFTPSPGTAPDDRTQRLN